MGEPRNGDLLKFSSGLSLESTYVWFEHSNNWNCVVQNGSFGIALTGYKRPFVVASDWICAFSFQLQKICWVHPKDYMVIK